MLCQKDSYLLELVRYIHLNPVRAGIVKRPGEWFWSGHARYLKGAGESVIDEGPVLSYFSEDGIKARAGYESFIREGTGKDRDSGMYPPEKIPYLGGEDFIAEHICRHIEVIEKATPGAGRPGSSLMEVLKAAGKSSGVSPEVIQGSSRKKQAAKARKEFIIAAYRAGHAPADISRFLRRSQSFASRLIDKLS